MPKEEVLEGKVEVCITQSTANHKFNTLVQVRLDGSHNPGLVSINFIGMHRINTGERIRIMYSQFYTGLFGEKYIILDNYGRAIYECNL